MVRKAVKKVMIKDVAKGKGANRRVAKVVDRATRANPILEQLPFAPKPEAQVIQVGPKRRDDVEIEIRIPEEVAKRLGAKAGPDGVVHMPETFLYDYIREQNERLANAKVMAQEEELRETNVMTKALDIIYGDREKTYGRPHINLESIAAMWTTYLQRAHAVRGTHDVVTIEDVCQMMVLLKMARLINDPTHKDSLVDEIGYIGLHERIQVR